MQTEQLRGRLKKVKIENRSALKWLSSYLPVQAIIQKNEIEKKLYYVKHISPVSFLYYTVFAE